MKIRKIEMVNFRGFQKKTIKFNDKPVILFSAANGVGKTTTVDAIEWCLTGSIGRLKNVFDIRSTNEPERKLNTNGILKNREAKPSEKVSVSLLLFDGEREILLCREQKGDVLDQTISTLTINGERGGTKEFIQEYVGESFYNFHVFDVQKTYNIQSTKRRDLKNLFSEFITNYDRQKQIADNLDIFVEDIVRYMTDQTRQKENHQTNIQHFEERLSQIQGTTSQIQYPADIFYRDEMVDITEQSRETLTKQRTDLANCGYTVAKKYLDVLRKNEEKKQEQDIIQQLLDYWDAKGASIKRAVQNGLWKNTDIIRERKSQLEQLNQLSLSKDTVLAEGESIIAIGDSRFTKSAFDTNKNAIIQKTEKERELSTEIDLLGKNNLLLKQLASLCANKQAVLDYRNEMLKKYGAVRCPVCGSEVFAEVSSEIILQEADDYIKRNGEIVKRKEEEKVALKAEINRMYQTIIDCAETVVEQKKASLIAEISEYNSIYKETQPYFKLIDGLKNTRKDLRIEDLTAEKLRELQTAVESELLEEQKERFFIYKYQRILKVLGYECENETVNQTYYKVSGLITRSIKVIGFFSFPVFVAKLNAIDSVLANQDLAELGKSIAEEREKYQAVERELKQLTKLKKRAEKRATEIRHIIEELSKDEYAKVGPSLFSYFNKLSRVNTSESIRIVPESEGISLVDDKGKNIVNTLSSGQLSVFILAYFFAGINARNEREKMKVFFIDDMTACMDDVNMLAFMDLLKYQISSKDRTMDQVFFITCDDRISRLLKYKMLGHGIELLELKDADFE